MWKRIALLMLVPALALAQSYTTFPNLQSGNVNFTATIRANGSACASGTAIVSGGGSVTCVAVIPSSQKGANNGVATLDSGGKVPSAQLPFTGLSYEGSWNANTNSPTLADGSGTGGDFYITSVAGSQNLGSGSITFAVGDWALYNGSIWQKVPSSAAVSSVFGRTGAVTATSGDYTATQITNTPAGGISATTAQAAINELDTEKQVAASTLTSWAALTRASGFDTFTQTPSSANLRGLLTDETGAGLAYFQGGALGTPASGTLTSATGLPWSTGLTGVPTTAVGYGITGGAKLDAYAGGDTPSAFTLGIVDSANAATWRAALGAPDGSNVALLNAANTFTSLQTLNDNIRVQGNVLVGSQATPFQCGTPVAYGTVAACSSYVGGADNNFFNKDTTANSWGGIGVGVIGEGAMALRGTSTASGPLIFGSPSGRQAVIHTGLVTPLVFGTHDVARLILGGTGNITMDAPDSGATLFVNALANNYGWATTTGTVSAGLYFNGTTSAQLFTSSAHPLQLGAGGAISATLIPGGGIQLGSPTGGDKGAGTLNTAGAIYQNNVSVALSDGSNLTALPAISGANLTTLNASNVSSGTLNNSRLPATINVATDLQVGGVSACLEDGTNCGGGHSGDWSSSFTYTNGSSASFASTQYIRVGNVVTGGFSLSYTVGASGVSALTFSPPIASDFTSSYDVTGACLESSRSGLSTPAPVSLFDSISGNTISIQWTSPSSGLAVVSCSFAYTVK